MSGVTLTVAPEVDGMQDAKGGQPAHLGRRHDRAHLGRHAADKPVVGQRVAHAHEHTEPATREGKVQRDVQAKVFTGSMNMDLQARNAAQL